MDQFVTSTPTPYFYETENRVLFCVKDGEVYTWSPNDSSFHPTIFHKPKQ